MKVKENLDSIGLNKDAYRVMRNICFVDIVAADLWKSDPSQYIHLLYHIATLNKLDIFIVEDYEKAMVLLINPIYYN